ncbi:STAS domain-containing protein [Nonomuraea sp. NN258]|uniref:STAS domain-containing protein n=1 Tax=Nonomuraea antri TaxID=2730852 RepID=UPI00156895CC|nr:STAS domain-containing protein [Nonomuraea antri]NRQ37641.1 STAS domain-containing protein [Nonomuraea antri]
MKVNTFRLLANLEGETFVLHPVGELDLSSHWRISHWLAGYLRDGPAPATLVDLADVAFIDSVGLGSLLHVTSRLRAGGHAVVFAAPRSQPAKLLLRTGLTRHLGVYGTAAEALRAVGPARPAREDGRAERHAPRS